MRLYIFNFQGHSLLVELEEAEIGQAIEALSSSMIEWASYNENRYENRGLANQPETRIFKSNRGATFDVSALVSFGPYVSLPKET